MMHFHFDNVTCVCVRCDVTGPLPSSISQLVSLTTLSLYYNRLTGSRVNCHDDCGDNNKVIFVCMITMTKLGTLPTYLSNMQRLKVVNLFGNKLNGKQL